MEENQNIEPEANAQEAESETVQAEASTPAQEVVENQSAPETNKHRKNGRNRSSKRGGTSGGSAQSAESCGELENPSEFHEKLSGSNVSGYGENSSDGQRQKRERRGDRRDRRSERQFKDEKPENAEASEAAESAATSEPAAEEKPEHTGPSFESRKFTPRAVEVGLSDRRPKGMPVSDANDGVVSYTPEDSKCSISLFDRIKNILKSIFGKKENSKKRYNKKGGKKNWSNNRDGKHFHHHGGNRNGGNKGGYNKRRYNDRRPNGGKPRGGNAEG